MNCTDIETHIDNYLDLSLTSFESKSFEDHIKNCDSCQQKVDHALNLQKALINLPIENTDDNFEQRLLDNVHTHYKSSNNHFTSGFITAMAASLAIWFAVSLFQPDSISQDTNSVNLTLHTPRDIMLKFDAPEKLDLVTLSIELPDHVELSGYPGRKTISWETKLNKGNNILTLPVKALVNGQGEMITFLKYGNKSKRFRIILNANMKGAWILKPSRIPAA